MADRTTIWEAFAFSPRIEGEKANKGFVVTLDGNPVLFMLSAYEMHLVAGTHCQRIIEIDGVEHEIALTVEGVEIA
jgi:hypothetical protein